MPDPVQTSSIKKMGRAHSFLDSPFVRVSKEVHQHEDLRRHLLRKVENFYQAKAVLFFTSFSNRSAAITDSDAEMLESILAAEHTAGKLLLIMNSPGGDAMAAERIVNVFRAYSDNKFEVLVPHMAKSAATMICFGASAIHMSKTAELGPVDPQVPYWEDGQDRQAPPKWISAEEYVRSYDDLMSRASSGKAKRLEPFIQQLSRYDARFIEQLRSIQHLSEDISVRLLQSSMMRGVSKSDIKRRLEVFLSQKKTSSHGRMINSEEAGACGLEIKLIDLHSPVWHTMWELYVRADWTVSNRCAKIIETSKTSVHA